MFDKFFRLVEKTHVLYLITFLFFISFFAHANTLGNELFFDDEDFLYKNEYVKTFAIDKFFTQNLIAGAGKVSNYYRPLLAITYAVEHKIFGLHPFIYHFTNVFLHTMVGILLFLILQKLFKQKAVPLLTSALFLIHPVQTEAVAYVSGRGDPLSTLFLLATIFSFLQDSPKWKLASLLFYLCGILSRETAIIAPALLILIFLFQTRSITGTYHKTKKLFPMIFVGISYFILRLTALNFQNTLNFYEAATPYSQSIVIRLLTFFSILPDYIALLLFPKTLNIERFPEVVTTILNVKVILSIFTTVTFFIASLLAFERLPLLFFGLLWFFVTISPTMGLIPINGIMYEHFLYLPLVGFFLLVSFLIVTIMKKASFLYALCTFIIFVSFSVLLFLRTVERNKDWKDPITFYKKTVSVNPKSARIRNNLAMSYAEKGQHKEAINEYKSAIAINDIYAESHFNLGNSYVAINDLNSAEKEYKLAIAKNPLFLRGYANLVSLYTFLGKKEEKEKIIQQLEKAANNDLSLQPYINYLRSL